MRSPFLIFVAPIIVLAAGCSPEQGASGTATGDAPLSADRSETVAEGDAPADAGASASTPPSKATPPPAAIEPAERDGLPLERGIYVLADSNCGSPANAAFRVWNGTGLSGSATRGCRSDAVTRDGKTFQVNNSCENTYDGSRSTERITVEVRGPDRFRSSDGEFRLCPAGDTPSWLRTLAEPKRQ